MENTKIFSEIFMLMQKNVSNEKIYDLIFNKIQKEVPFKSASLFIYNKKDKSLVHEFQIGEDIVNLISEFDFGGGVGFSGWAINQKKPVILSSLPNNQVYRKGQIQSFVTVPLWVDEILFGVVNLGHTEKGKYSKKQIKIFQDISSELSLMFEHLLMRKETINLKENINDLIKELENKNNKLTHLKDSVALGKGALKLKKDIRKPLSSIIGLAELLELSIHTLSTKRIKETLRALVSESKKMKNIINKVNDNS